MTVSSETPSFDDVQRILVIQFRPIGDVLLSTPLVHALRDRYPEAHIAFLTEAAPAEVLQHNPHLDEVILYRKESLWKSLTFFRSLRAWNFDLAIDLRGTTGTAGAAYLCGARYRVGYVVRARRFAYNLPVENNMTEVRYSALKKQILLKRIGISDERSEVMYRVTEEERAFVRAFLSAETGDPRFSERPFFTLGPTSKRQSRRWRLEGFAEVADRLISEHHGVVVALSGSNETEYIDELERHMETGPLIRPRTSIRQAAALMEAADVHIGNDNGLRHIAAAVGTPTVAVFGPANPVVWTPPDQPQHRIIRSDVPCLGCPKTECGHHTCMADVSAEQVLREVRSLLEFSPAGHSSCIPSDDVPFGSQ